MYFLRLICYRAMYNYLKFQKTTFVKKILNIPPHRKKVVLKMLFGKFLFY